MRSWYSQAAAGSQFVGQMYQTGEPQVLNRRTRAGRAPEARARAEKPAGVRLLRPPARDDEADRRLDDGVEATVGREADSPALPLALLVPVGPLTEGGASVEHELRLEPPAAPSSAAAYSCSSRSRSRSTSARRPV